MAASPDIPPLDLAIVGGGLAGGLLALTLAQRRPEWRVLLVEDGEALGGNHIWSFFETDVTADQRARLAPMIATHWSGYDVRFPGFERHLTTGYNSIRSEDFDSHIRASLPDGSVRTGVQAVSIEPETVTLEGGERLHARAVVDARGGGNYGALRCGWQKFVGQLLELDDPHGVTHPVIMDARVDQAEGYRFVYSLPFGEKAVFVEDTYYADAPDVDVESLKARIADYAARQGWRVVRATRTEQGCLPVLHGGDFAAFRGALDAGVPTIGARAGFIHPMTSYSLPLALRTADAIAELATATPDALRRTLDAQARDHWRDTKFYRFLAAMLFRSADPDQRYRTLAHTYTKEQGLIERFYAGKITAADKARLLIGKPPVPVHRALAVLRDYPAI